MKTTDTVKKTHITQLSLYAAALLAIPAVNADTFGSGANTFTMDFVDIGNAGNAADNTGYGAVGYNYRMGTHEVSRGMIDSYNAHSGGPTITMYDMTYNGGNGASRPSTGISWNEAARFVNWLNTSSGYSAAYKFSTGGANDNIALWQAGDAGYDVSNPFRNSNAHYFLPSEDEWYKAAYYDPNYNGVGNGGYWNYATASNSHPSAVSGGTTADTTVHYGQSSPADIDNAGGLSAYGTMAQNGNVWEWGESAFDGSNNRTFEYRVARGGSWLSGYNSPTFHSAHKREDFNPAYNNYTVGFRVASVDPTAVPEPSSSALLGLGAISLLLRRRR